MSEHRKRAFPPSQRTFSSRCYVACFLREKSRLLSLLRPLFPLYPVWLSVPKGSLTKYLTAAAVADSAAERTVSEVLYIRSHIFDTGREGGREEEESSSQWENKSEMIIIFQTFELGELL